MEHAIADDEGLGRAVDVDPAVEVAAVEEGLEGGLGRRREGDGNGEGQGEEEGGGFHGIG